MFTSSEFLLLLIIAIPAVSAFIGFYIGMKSEDARNHFYTAVTIIVFALILYLYKDVKTVGELHYFLPGIMGTGLFLKLDMLRYVLIFLTSFLWILSHVFSTHYLLKYKNRNRYYMFFILTFSCTLGVFLSEHILNLFTFFELMTVTSYFLVIHDEDEFTHRAGNMYIAMSIAGGLIQLMGIFLLFSYVPTLFLSDIPSALANVGNIKYLIAILIIIGFAVKACMFPFHIWLPKVYPPIPSPATALFSGVLTKTGVFGILITLQFMNYDILLSLIIFFAGLINMFLGGLLAIHHRNIKKVFAYSSMSQIGYILFGIGAIGLLKGHNYDVYYAGIFHMINHALLKTLLFFGSGIIFMALQKLSLNEMKGFGRNKPIFKLVLAVGFLGTIGIPGFNGFASKSMLHHAIGEAGILYNSLLITFVDIIFVISGAFTAAYLIKIFICLFVDESKEYIEGYNESPSKYAIVPMLFLSVLIVFIGIKPDILLAAIGYTDTGHLDFYTIKDIGYAILSAAGGILIYVFYIHKHLRIPSGQDYVLVNPTYGWFDLEKHLFKPVLSFLFRYISLLLYGIDNILVFIASNLSAFAKYLFSIDFHKDLSFKKYGVKWYIAGLLFLKNVSNRLRNRKAQVIQQYNGISNIDYSAKGQKLVNDISIKRNHQKNEIKNIFDQYKDSEMPIPCDEEKADLFRFEDLSSKLSSITYSIIIFALILAVLLIWMLTRSI
ncbi:MAG: hypothetical protein GX285_02740 [Clostridiales bacterium]|nr:hypothetical protein [Clostridiales bacterium]